MDIKSGVAAGHLGTLARQIESDGACDANVLRRIGGTDGTDQRGSGENSAKTSAVHV